MQRSNTADPGTCGALTSDNEYDVHPESPVEPPFAAAEGWSVRRRRRAGERYHLSFTRAGKRVVHVHHDTWTRGSTYAVAAAEGCVMGLTLDSARTLARMVGVPAALAELVTEDRFTAEAPHADTGAERGAPRDGGARGASSAGAPDGDDVRMGRGAARHGNVGEPVRDGGASGTAGGQAAEDGEAAGALTNRCDRCGTQFAPHRACSIEFDTVCLGCAYSTWL